MTTRARAGRVRSSVARALVILAATLLFLGAIAGPAAAHPLGNLSVNTFSRLVIGPDAVTIDVVVDAAEIPTLRDFPDVNRRRGNVTDDARVAYQRNRCGDVRDSIDLLLDGRRMALDVGASSLTFPPGSAGLRTSRLTCALASTGRTAVVGASLDYRIDANVDRVGWREITAVGSGVQLGSSDVPGTSTSAALTSYPADLLSSPPNQTEAHVTVGPAAEGGSSPDDLVTGPTSVLPRGVDRFSKTFTDLVARQELGVGFALLAVLAAMALGALHAFAPGHGKTVMAAYLIGREGSFRQAAIVGSSVTATHTFGVLALGLALTGAGLASPERVYPWLGTASGLLLAGIGVGLLLRQRARPAEEPAVGGGRGQRGDHGDGHGHEPPAAHEQRHRHGLLSHTHLPPARNVRGLIALGFAGGLVPSPSALLVLLGGVALGRAWFGVVLVLAYGVGMAAALMATGLLLVSARDAVNRMLERRTTSISGHPLATLLARGLPLATASVVAVVGLGIAVRSAAQI